jgi:hypothetical protein
MRGCPPSIGIPRFFPGFDGSASGDKIFLIFFARHIDVYSNMDICTMTSKHTRRIHVIMEVPDFCPRVAVFPEATRAHHTSKKTRHGLPIADWGLYDSAAWGGDDAGDGVYSHSFGRGVGCAGVCPTPSGHLTGADGKPNPAHRGGTMLRESGNTPTRWDRKASLQHGYTSSTLGYDLRPGTCPPICLQKKWKVKRGSARISHRLPGKACGSFEYTPLKT